MVGCGPFACRDLSPNRGRGEKRRSFSRRDFVPELCQVTLRDRHTCALALWRSAAARVTFSSMADETGSKKQTAARGDDFLTLREGEVAVAPPEKFDASVYFIGRIRTPWHSREQ